MKNPELVSYVLGEESYHHLDQAVLARILGEILKKSASSLQRPLKTELNYPFRSGFRTLAEWSNKDAITYISRCTPEDVWRCSDDLSPQTLCAKMVMLRIELDGRVTDEAEHRYCKETYLMLAEDGRWFRWDARYEREKIDIPDDPNRIGVPIIQFREHALESRAAWITGGKGVPRPEALEGLCKEFPGALHHVLHDLLKRSGSLTKEAEGCADGLKHFSGFLKGVIHRAGMS